MQDSSGYISVGYQIYSGNDGTSVDCKSEFDTHFQTWHTETLENSDENLWFIEWGYSNGQTSTGSCKHRHNNFNVAKLAGITNPSE